MAYFLKRGKEVDSMTISRVLLVTLIGIGSCGAVPCEESSAGRSQQKVYATKISSEKSDADPVDAVLKQLNKATTQLKSYQCVIEHKVTQPLFETQTVRRGMLYYHKSAETSKLRVNFNILKQDNEEEQKHLEQYIINGTGLAKLGYQLHGVWLTHIDYQIKQVQIHQLAEPDPADPNEAVDAFELVSRTFPLIGFTKADELRKQFDIRLLEQPKAEAARFVLLRLKVKPDSVYKDDYTSIDFWIDKDKYLPARIVTTSTEEDIYQIKLTKPKINKGLDKEVFDIEIPKGFPKPEIIPLKTAQRAK